MTTLFLEIPLTPVEGETRHIPLSQCERKAPFLALPCLSWLQRRWEEPCFHPLFTQTAARRRQTLFAACVLAGFTPRMYPKHRTCSFWCAARWESEAGGSPACQGSGWGPDPQHLFPALGHAVVAAKPTEHGGGGGLLMGSNPSTHCQWVRALLLGLPLWRRGGAGSVLGRVAPRGLATSSQEL